MIFGINITRGIYAKYHYKSCYYLYKFKANIITLAITIGERSQAKVKLFLSAGKCTRTSQECCGFYFVECVTKWEMFCQSSPRSTYLNSNVTPRLSGHYSIISLVFFALKSLLGIARHWSLEKFAVMIEF